MAGGSLFNISPQVQDLGRRWYVLTPDYQREAAMAQVAAQHGAEVFMPTEKRQVRHARRIVDKAYPVISGYLFLRLDLLRDPWQDIGHHRHSLGFLGVQAGPDGVLRPAAVRQDQMDKLIGHLEQVPPEETGEIFPILKPGQRALIHTGILKDFTGCVVTDEDGRTLIWLDKKFGGKEVEVARESVRKA